MTGKTNLIGTMNAGYTIIKQGEVAVIAEYKNKDAGTTAYVAWHYKFNDGNADFFWGRYGSREHTEESFDKKEKGIYSGN